MEAEERVAEFLRGQCPHHPHKDASFSKTCCDECFAAEILAAVAEEREECARVVQDMASECEKWADGAPLRIASRAIRARGERGDG